MHPTKHEVRFREPRHIHDFVRHAIARALGGFTSETPPETVPMSLEGGTRMSPETGAPMSAGTGAADALTAGTAPGVVGDGPGETGAVPGSDGSGTPYPMGRARPGEARVGDHLAAYAALSAGSRGTTAGGTRARVRLGGYVIVEGAATLLLIDLRAGRGALVRDRLDESARTANAVSRPLLIPHQKAVSESVADAVDGASAALRSLGIEVRRGAPGSVTLRAIPPCLAGVAPDGLLDAIAGWARTSGPVTDLIDSLAALAESSPFDGDSGDIVDAAVGGRLGAAVAEVDEAMLRHLLAGAGRR